MGFGWSSEIELNQCSFSQKYNLSLIPEKNLSKQNEDVNGCRAPRGTHKRPLTPHHEIREKKPLGKEEAPVCRGHLAASEKLRGKTALFCHKKRKWKAELVVRHQRRVVELPIQRRKRAGK